VARAGGAMADSNGALDSSKEQTDALWLELSQEAILQAARLVPLSSRAMHGSGTGSVPSPQEGPLKDSLQNRDDNLKIVMKLEDNLYQMAGITAQSQVEQSVKAEEAVRVWERVEASGAAAASGVAIDDFTAARNDLQRSLATQRLMQRLVEEAVFKSGVDWTKRPELEAVVLGKDPGGRVRGADDDLQAGGDA